LVTTTVASATPVSPLKAEVVSFEAIVFKENIETNKNPMKRLIDLLNILKSPSKLLYIHYVHLKKILKKLFVKNW
jgi:hypothetical protein